MFVFQALPIGTSVGYVSASDADIGENAELTYSFVSNTMNAQYFYIDSIYPAGTGVIKTAKVRQSYVTACLN